MVNLIHLRLKVVIDFRRYIGCCGKSLKIEGMVFALVMIMGGCRAAWTLSYGWEDVVVQRCLRVLCFEG